MSQAGRLQQTCDRAVYQHIILILDLEDAEVDLVLASFERLAAAEADTEVLHELLVTSDP